MNKRKIYNILISMLMVFNVISGPLTVFAQEQPVGNTEQVTPAPTDTETSPAEETDAAQPAPAAPEAEAEGEKAQEATEVPKRDDEEKKEDTIVNAPLTQNDYTLSTKLTINNNPLIDGGKYGEGKFYIAPTYTFTDNAVLHDGDTLTYTVPSQFVIERTIDENITAPTGEVIARVVTNPATNIATLTVTNAEYFKNLNEDKTISTLFTVIWAPTMPYDVATPVTFDGAGPYTLTRIRVDEEPQGYSKWGVQDSKDPNLVNWRIRVNRDVKNLGAVTITDVIPDGQELEGAITGYYFTDWFNEKVARVKFGQDIVTVTDSHNFTINPEQLDGKGIFIIYQTRLTKPVDKVTKKAFNNVTVTSNGTPLAPLPQPFAPLTVVDGIGTGARSDEAIFTVKKVLTGRNLKENEFTFKLLDPAGQVIQTKTNAANGEVTFDKIKFSAAGTYRYTIREEASGLPGVTDDANKEITATVVVVNVNGVKTATVAYSRTEFTNTYAPKATTAPISVNKTLTGRTLAENEFEFELKDENGTVLETKANATNGTVTFTPVSITEVGTKTYKVVEKVGTATGVTYDTKEVTVTVETIDNNGQLEATVSYSGGGQFANTYAALATTAPISVNKTLTGRSLAENEFEFDLKDEQGTVLQTKANAADGTVTFTPVQITEVGTKTYKVVEKAGTATGVTYDTKEVTVTVTTVDNNGQLEATVTYPDGNQFTNTYVPTATTIQINALKHLRGRTLVENEFEFELKDENNAVVETKANDVDGNVLFTPISITEVGTKTYKIVEKPGSLAGVTYDTKEITVTVETVDNNGQLASTVTYQGGNQFTNTYVPAATTATISVNKTLTGRALAADEFEFELKDDANAVVQTVRNAADGTVAFTPIQITEVGTKTYKVVEKAGTATGVTYDTKEITATVTTVDNKGQLEATVTYSDGGQFANNYAALSTTAPISVTKALTGRALAENEFEFDLKDEQGTVLQTKGNAADGTVAFTPVQITEVGTKTYKVVEKVGTATGVTYDTKEITVTVTTTDNNGQLESVVTYTDEGKFTNAYAPLATTAPVAVKKELTGRALVADEFEFELKDDTDAVVQTKRNAADGTVTFDALPITAVGTKTYKVVEKAGSTKGVTYDTKEITVTVTTTDNGGQLESVVTYTGEGKFTNAYVPLATTAPVAVKKELTGRALVADEFEFELKDDTDAVVQTKRNAADGTVTFDALPITAVGTKTYKVVEKAGAVAGVTYDTKEITVTVTTTDNNGQLESVVTYTNDATFNNTYAPAATTATLSVVKELTGRTLAAGEFEFELKDDKGNVVQTKTNDADGKVNFDALDFTAAGTMKYTISEKVADVAGVTYDTTAVEATVTVVDENAQLKATVAYTKDAKFINTYKAGTTSAVITATKKLTGRALEADEFEFELKDEAGTVLSTKKNDVTGQVVFDALTYDTVGTKTYTITEKAGTVKNVTYDERVLTAVVEVTDDNQGQLHAKVSYTAGQEFTNTYSDPSAAVATIHAKKVLEGRELKEGEFEFELVDEAGNGVTAKNDAAGNVELTREFKTEGEYKFALREKAGDEAGIEYDKTTYEVTVTVTTNAEGKLVATVNMPKEAVFHNVYRAPKPVLPRTGEDSFALLFAGIASVLAMIAGYLVFRFKRRV